MDGNHDVDAILSGLASNLLYKLAETEPPPLKWFPKELAIHAAHKLAGLALAEPRHAGTNQDDFASRDYRILTAYLPLACKELVSSQRETWRPTVTSGCSIVAEALNLKRVPA